MLSRALSCIAMFVFLSIPASSSDKLKYCTPADIKSHIHRTISYIFVDPNILLEILSEFDVCHVSFKYESPNGRDWSTKQMRYAIRLITVDTIFDRALSGCVTDIPLEKSVSGNYRRCF